MRKEISNGTQGRIDAQMFLLKMSVALIQQPLWWITAFLWGLLLTLTVPFHTLRLWYRRYIPFRVQWQKQHAVRTQQREALPNREDVWRGAQDHFSLIAPRIAMAFEHPFQRMGVRTEEYRQEI